MKKIERLRSELNQLTQQRSLLDPLVIKKSQQLDKLIVHYMKRIPRRKASYVPDTATDTIKMNFFFRKVRSPIRRELDNYFGKVERLHREIEELAKEHHLFDPVVTEKSRELDKLIMSGIKPPRS
ncbi:aspartyl-phosphate phosphatase Spo0E family protein [Paenibacillus contaminans]|uniref:Aspartyl-phosphate phosphatase Spo0E family protein n=1 Tax=Paenibacillus contaminans TaxID=450362 RepID=A0A329MKP0_9BACL|nr:aspartyl-phosphate phosphatase Spo0E family protein [Paenibacillus contaminans]RAV20202.1 hypothetical protein DQG23_17215 [Paenibacillus contaminans]